jgi:hypothetical protein
VGSLADLSPAARLIVESRSISRSFRLRPLLRLLAELQRWALFNERRKTVLGHWQATGCGSLFWGPLAIWYCYDLGRWQYIAAAIAVSLAVMLAAKARRKILERLDVPSEVYRIARPLLKRLRQDIDPAAKLRFRLRLAAGPAPAKKENRKGYRTVKISVTEACLMRIRIPLVDGSIAALLVRSRLRHLAGWKQKSPNEIKRKQRWKRVSKVSVKFRPAAARADKTTSSRYQFRSDTGPPADAPPASAALNMLFALAAKSRPR